MGHLLIAAAALVMLASPWSASSLAQQQGTRAPTPVLSRMDNDYREWTLRFGVDVIPLLPFKALTERERQTPQASPTLILEDSAFVFPIIQDTGWTTARNGLIRGDVRAGRNLSTEFRTINNFQGPSSIGVWRLPNVNASSLTFEVDIALRAYRLNIDEARAVSQYPWPTQPYAPEIAINLQPQLFVQSDHPVVVDLVDHWLGGRSPRDAPPYRLAKFLAGKVVEHVQPTGSGLSSGSISHPNVRQRAATNSGFECYGAAYAARYGVGSPHDLANLLCAAYRAAGIPARLTIAVDTNQINTNYGLASVRAFVEFYLYNETLDFGEWIPVDIQRQRDFSSKAPPLDQRWEHFGHMEDGARMAPIAHHWHPPAGVLNAGPPALWGWVVSPGIPLATQNVRLTAGGTPRAAMEGKEDGYIAIRDQERSNR